MTAYADLCTRIYSPNGRVAHLSEPGWPGGAPLCPAVSARSWFGTGSQEEYDRAASLPLCARCVKEAAARDSQTSPVEPPGPGLPDAAPGDAAAAPQDPAPRRGPARPAADQTPAGSVQPAGCAAREDAEPAGTTPPATERHEAALSGAGFRERWKTILYGRRAGQRGDRGRRARRGQGLEYRPGQNRRGGPS